MKVDIFVI